MNYASGSLRGESIAAFSLVVDAARRWREARDTGQPVQPHLFAALARDGYGVLAPVLDSLMHLYELALHRPLQTGIAHILSADEDRLLVLLFGPRHEEAGLPSGDASAHMLDCALASARIMFALSSVPLAEM